MIASARPAGNQHKCVAGCVLVYQSFSTPDFLKDRQCYFIKLLFPTTIPTFRTTSLWFLLINDYILVRIIFHLNEFLFLLFLLLLIFVFRLIFSQWRNHL